MRISMLILTAGAVMAACATTSTPSAPAPTNPAAPTATVPPTPPPPEAPASPAGMVGTTVDGQWAYTTQYGWVWMPYGSDFTSLSAGVGAVPLMYVYTPAAGWRWVSAPWVWGLGPRPWFAAGPERFVWYGRPWMGHPGHGFRGGYGHRFVHAWHG
jgi:hypothetical protein